MKRTRKTSTRIINSGHASINVWPGDNPDAPPAWRLDGYQEAGDHVQAIRRLYAQLMGYKPPSFRESFPQGELEETQKRVRMLVAKRIQEWRRREEQRTGVDLREELEKAMALPAPERDRRIAELEAIHVERQRRLPRSYKYPVRERYHVPGCEYPDGMCSRDCESIEDFRQRAKGEARYLRLEPAGTFVLEHVEWTVRVQSGEKVAFLAKEIVAAELAANPIRVFKSEQEKKEAVADRILAVVRNIDYAIDKVLEIVGEERRYDLPGRPRKKPTSK